MQRLKSYLKEFINIDNEIFEELKSNIEFVKVPRKTLLLQAGNVATHLYFIEEGLVRFFYINEKNMEVTPHLVLEGYFFSNFHSFSTSTPSKISIETIEKSTLYRISKENLFRLYDQYREIEKLGRIISEENSQKP